MLGPLLLVATALALAARLSIAGCSGFGYAPGIYLADCSNGTYGDYEHAALALDFEAVRRPIERADVVFFGYSHAYVAFSGEGTARYLAARRLSFYDLALSGEVSAFPQRYLLPLIGHARFVVIDVDPFFYGPDVMARPGRLITRSIVQATIEYEAKAILQSLHRAACAGPASPGDFLCGRAFSSFRRVDNGNVITDYGLVYRHGLPHHPVAVVPVSVAAELPRHLPYARDFVEHLHLPRRCIVFTEVPSSNTRIALVEAMARALGVSFVEPDPGGLETVDTGHLNAASVALWSAAFWKIADPVVRSCAAAS